MAKHWFKAKMYGYGATPCSWQGWAVTGGFVLLLAGGAVAVHRISADPHRARLMIVGAAVPLIAGFLWICKAKGDGVWRWRWGE